MISDTQQQALAALAEVWRLSSDVRLGQLLAHLGFLGEVHLGKGLGEIEDDELMAVLDRHRVELVARLGGDRDAEPLTSGQTTSVLGHPTQPQPAAIH